MTHSAVNGERRRLAEWVGAADYSARAMRVLQRISSADAPDELLAAFREATLTLGADAAVFTSYIRDDATLASYRTLLACDPAWAPEYARQDWHADDPWLRHALHDSEPIRSTELVLRSERERAFVEAAAGMGFASAVIVAAPSSQGPSRVGVLCLGSTTTGFFEDQGYETLRILARALAMELHACMRRSIRRELMVRSRLTPKDIELLRHEASGHSSKVIAAALNTEAKTIDCRFQRVSAKLESPNRRAAVRVARLYGLI